MGAGNGDPRDATAYYRDAYTFMFIAVLYIRANKWNWSVCSSTDDWIMKMWVKARDGAPVTRKRGSK